MAIYHHSIKIISRGKGKSAVAAAAYRSGEIITNEYDGITHDYTHKSGIAHAEILLPDNAPNEYHDRAILWNAVEKSEKNCNAQLAREIELTLPVELTQEQNIELTRDYCQRHFVTAGMCADICIHDKKDGNPHAHIMLTMRPITESGEWAAKSKKEYFVDENGERLRLANGNFKTRKISAVDWNEHIKAEEWREGWAVAANAALEQSGNAERIDHRSYARQGIEQIPAVHLGVAASQMERRGIRTERGDLNRQIEISNAELRRTRARILKLRDWLKAEQKTDTPMLYDVIQEILSSAGSQNRYAKICDLKSAAGVLNFMQENHIATIGQLREKVEDLYRRQTDLRDRLKPIDRRLKTLDKHFKQTEIVSRNRTVYSQYMAQKPKSKKAFYEAHRAEIMLYEAAARYIKANLNGRDKIPLKEWKAERVKLIGARSVLDAGYQILKAEIRDVETIRKYAEQIARSAEPPQKQHVIGMDR